MIKSSVSRVAGHDDYELVNVYDETALEWEVRERTEENQA